MFSNRVSSIFRPLRVRLTLWFASLFLLCLFLILGISYYLLSASLQAKDQELIRSKWREYSELLVHDGIPEVAHKLEEDEQIPGTVPYVVLVQAGPAMPYSYVPRALRHFEVYKAHDNVSLDPVREQWGELTSKKKGDSLDLYKAPFEPGAFLTVGKSRRDRLETLSQFRSVLAVTILPILVFGLFAGWFISSRALLPLRSLSSTARTIYEGNLAARVQVTGSGDELDELGKLFNRMLERVQILINGMRDTLDNVAHDLRTPMTRFRGLVEEGLSAGTLDGQREALSEGLDSSEDILRLLNTLMDVSSSEAGTLKLSLENVDLSDVTSEAFDLYRLLAEEKDLQMTLSVSEKVWVSADKTRMSQVLANLFDNAVKYTAPGGRIEAGVSREGEFAVFRISDTGQGIPAEEISRIWDRLYRGDSLFMSKPYRGNVPNLKQSPHLRLVFLICL